MLTEQAVALRILMNDDIYFTSRDFSSGNNNARQDTLEEPVINLEQSNIPEPAFIGKNLKNFLILSNQLLPENHLKALESTLIRKQLSLDDIAIIDYSASDNFKFDQLHASFMPQKLVCFGLKPETLGLPETEINHISDYSDCQILFTYSFHEMLGNKEKTKAFWEQMKNL